MPPSIRLRHSLKPLLILFVIVMSRVFIVVSCFIHYSHFDWVDRNNLQVGTALVALQRLAFFYVVCINRQRVIALWARNSHNEASKFSLCTTACFHSHIRSRPIRMKGLTPLTHRILYLFLATPRRFVKPTPKSHD